MNNYQILYQHYRARTCAERLVPHWRDTVLPDLDKHLSRRLPSNTRHEAFTGGFTTNHLAYALREYDYLQATRPEWLTRFSHQAPPYLHHDERLPRDLDRADLHNLHHLAVWEETTGGRIEDLDLFVEWGGGWGRLAELVVNLSPGCTYVVLDLPIVSYLQSCLLPWANFDSGFLEPGVNLVPVDEDPHLLEPDLFISTWALSESSALDVEVVRDRGFLDAPHLLLAYDPADERFPMFQALEGLPGQVVSAAPDTSWYLVR